MKLYIASVLLSFTFFAQSMQLNVSAAQANPHGLSLQIKYFNALIRNNIGHKVFSYASFHHEDKHSQLVKKYMEVVTNQAFLQRSATLRCDEIGDELEHAVGTVEANPEQFFLEEQITANQWKERWAAVKEDLTARYNQQQGNSVELGLADHAIQ